MGSSCGCQGYEDTQNVVMDQPAGPLKKYVRHEGTFFKSDEEAQKAGETWAAANEGWTFKGKHKM